MNWNVLNDGLLDPNREQNFARVLQAINPDVIGFNEMWNSTVSEVQNKLNNILLLQTGSWSAVKLDGGTVTASKYPIIQSWLVYPGQRITASLIDLPEQFGNNILVINCHYKCCGGSANDATRQREADATVAFILDSKTPGGVIDLPPNTPFVILGDLNFVGDRQQLITLLTGEIINTQLFGNSGPPDWDDSELEDLLSSQSDKRTAYTWRDDPNSFSPGRLDYQIYSNSVMNVEKHFVLQTEVMSPARLNQYGLQMYDTRNASDHFPKVSDISINIPTKLNIEPGENNFRLEQNYPNPFNPKTNIRYAVGDRQFVSLKVYDILGNELSVLVTEEQPAGEYEVVFDGRELASGIYFSVLKAGIYFESKKMILLK
jgi:endonuclease/exonuclease/phosphatase family metal-dependent hydrolase